MAKLARSRENENVASMSLWICMEKYPAAPEVVLGEKVAQYLVISLAVGEVVG